MAADASSLLRLMNGYKEDKPAVDSSRGGGKSTVTITRDLLGGGNCGISESTELDLDLEVPKGWEKRLDLKSGKVYLQKSDFQNKPHYKESFTKLQDLNFPPSKQPLNIFDETSLDLKLLSSPSSPNYQSVCTLDKVKSALERVERETKNKKRSVSFSKSSSPGLSNSSSSVKDTKMDTDYEEKASLSFAAACSTCFHYVLVWRSNPNCPRCHAIVQSPVAVKKPRIDLNISI